MAHIINGKAHAAAIKENLKNKISVMPVPPSLAVVLVGNDPASLVYVSGKEKACGEIGIRFTLHTLPEDTPQEKLLTLLDTLNANGDVNGILVQNPLPRHLDKHAVVSRIDPQKDVDCLNPVNIGLLATGKAVLPPCTPDAVMTLLALESIPIAGKHCVIVGRSDIVGKPLAFMMLAKDATVTVCHSKTRNLASVCQTADILVAAVGVRNLITAEMVKEGCVVIDVGITRLEGKKITGDVDYKNCKEKSSAITPVPGGVGPMTIAKLMENCVRAWEFQNNKYEYATSR
jgi:methylenetetrahydrofolate dehydrogenase (NADP+)/methenyltetrahydrofolate cyclohydrolase